MEKKCNGCKKKLEMERFIENNRTYSKCHDCRLKLVKQKNICSVCGVRALYNYDGETVGTRCLTHKEPDMMNVISRRCVICYKKQPVYNNKGEKIATHCGDCKTDDMVNVKQKKCIVCKIKQPSFNLIGETSATHCSECKSYDMINVLAKRCVACHTTIPTFNYTGEITATHCGGCKMVGMVNIVSKMCTLCQTSQAVFNYKDETSPTHCGKCKTEGMINLKSKKCIICKIKCANFNYTGNHKATHCGNCKESEMINIKQRKCVVCQSKEPRFNTEGNTTPTHCGDCKSSEMIDIKMKKCIICKIKRAYYNYKDKITATHCVDCKEGEMIYIINRKCIVCKNKIPSFNHKGELKATHCGHCKEPGMVDIKSKKCIICKNKIPHFNREGESTPTHCGKCREPEMVDVIHKKCQHLACRKIASFAHPGFSPEFCFTHKQSGMMSNPRRRCIGSEEEDCKEFATHGITEPLHCEEHAQPDEYHLVERTCPRCGKMDVLNKSGICVNFCSLEEKDQLMKKRIKKKEEYIRNLLEKEIDIKDDVIQTWQDEVIDSTCTKRRPDFVYHCGTFVIIVEVDEGQHKSYTNCGNTEEEKKRAENRRMVEISQIFQGIPVVWIRYNPDGFKDKSNKPTSVSDRKRHEVLIQWIKKAIRTKWEDGIYVKYLFYNGYDTTDITFYPLVHTDI